MIVTVTPKLSLVDVARGRSWRTFGDVVAAGEEPRDRGVATAIDTAGAEDARAHIERLLPVPD